MSDNNGVNVIINTITGSSAQDMYEYMMEAAELFLKIDDNNFKQQCLSGSDISTQKTQEHMLEAAELILKIDEDTHEQENKQVNYSNKVEFQNFVKRRLAENFATNGGQLIKRNTNMSRNFRSAQTNERYLEHREQNNAAARKSRDRKKTDELLKKIRLEYLESRNVKLKSELEIYNGELFGDANLLARNVVLPRVLQLKN